MQQTTKRLDHIDIAKAIGLLLVIYGHTFRMSMRAAHPWCAFSYTFVYRFHVPLLFLLSGMGCTLTAQKNRSLSARQYVRYRQPAAALGYIFGFFVLFVLSGESSAAGAGAAVRRCIPVKTACGISLVGGCATRTPMVFICGICLRCSGLSSRHGCWTKPCPRQQPGRQSWCWW